MKYILKRNIREGLSKGLLKMEIKNWLELINRSISKRINKEIILRKDYY